MQQDEAANSKAQEQQEQGARTYPWWVVAATMAVPPMAAILMHIPEYIKYPDRTLTGIGIALTVLGGLGTLFCAAAIMSSKEEPDDGAKLFITAVAVAATAGVLILCRGQL